MNEDAIYERIIDAIEGEHPAQAKAALERAVAEQWAVRRLTPPECERLQGFPDGYTDVPPRNKNHTPDGPRYKALGNAMAVNVMRWLGRRIEHVEILRSISSLASCSRSTTSPTNKNSRPTI